MNYLGKSTMYQLITEKMKEDQEPVIQDQFNHIPDIHDSIYEVYRGMEKIELVISDSKKNLYRLTMMRSGNMILFLMNQIFEHTETKPKEIFKKEMKLDQRYQQLLRSDAIEP